MTEGTHILTLTRVLNRKDQFGNPLEECYKLANKLSVEAKNKLCVLEFGDSNLKEEHVPLIHKICLLFPNLRHVQIASSKLRYEHVKLFLPLIDIPTLRWLQLNFGSFGANSCDLTYLTPFQASKLVILDHDVLLRSRTYTERFFGKEQYDAMIRSARYCYIDEIIAMLFHSSDREKPFAYRKLKIGDIVAIVEQVFVCMKGLYDSIGNVFRTAIVKYVNEHKDFQQKIGSYLVRFHGVTIVDNKTLSNDNPYQIDIEEFTDMLDSVYNTLLE